MRRNRRFLIEQIARQLIRRGHSRPQLTRHGFLLVALVSWFVCWMVYQLVATPQPILVQSADHGLTEPITVRFDKPFNHLMVSAQLRPPASGEWQPIDPVPGTSLYRGLRFTPSASLLPEQTYHAVVSGLAPALGAPVPNTTIVPITTASLPKITDSSLEADDHAPCKLIRFTFDQPLGSPEAVNVAISPETTFERSLADQGRTLVVAFPECLTHDTEYALEVTINLPKDDAVETDLLAKKYEPYEEYRTLRTRAAPSLSLAHPAAPTVAVDLSSITVSLSEPVDRESFTKALSIEPTLAGTWQWKDDATVSFLPNERLQYGRQYAVRTTDRIRTTAGNYLEPTEHTFQTYGALAVSGTSPRNGSTSVASRTPIKFTFNQPVDQQAAEQAFSLSPPSAGAFSWRGNTLSFLPDGLAPSTTYTATIAPGVASRFGLPSTAPYSVHFTTIEQLTLLDVPYDRQDYALSCEASALTMALAYYGVDISEDEILARLGRDGPLHRDGDFWGNPNHAYVGDVHGTQNSTGYGVHWGPIATVGSAWRPTQAFSGWSASQLAAELAAGHPVVIWGVSGRGAPDSWQVPGGGRVSTWVGEHTWTVVGFAGSVDTPTAFYVHNPLGGARVRWNTSAFVANWSALGRSGVIVR